MAFDVYQQVVIMEIRLSSASFSPEIQTLAIQQLYSTRPCKKNLYKTRPGPATAYTAQLRKTIIT
jgi:hypothetical protein